MKEYEKEREIERNIYINVYVYICVYIDRERDVDGGSDGEKRKRERGQRWMKGERQSWEEGKKMRGDK